MSLVLSHGKFGESAIRLVRVLRKGDLQELRDLSVQLLLKGDFDRGFTEGEALPLGGEQAIAERVYALAHEYCSDQIEPFALVFRPLTLSSSSRISRLSVTGGTFSFLIDDLEFHAVSEPATAALLVGGLLLGLVRKRGPTS